MVRNVYCFFFLFFCVLLSRLRAEPNVIVIITQDTTIKEIDLGSTKISMVNSKALTSDSIRLKAVKNNPFISIGEMVKGQVSGVHVQHPSAEPGAFQNILVRGLSSVQFSNRDINNNQAQVYINGVPVSFENSFAYDIQRYDFNRIGPATDYLSSYDLSSIESIEIIKDPVRLAELGPLASNGAIWITTYGGRSGPRHIALNSYFGFNTTPVITPVNADYENRFRQGFYAKYAADNAMAKLSYPNYLLDQTNLNYYGASDWEDLYYSNAPLQSIDLRISGGSDRANFGFYGGYTANTISSDDTGLKRYNTLFNVNMLPFTWLKVGSYVSARRTERDRNRNLRDRYGEMAYLPDLSTPLSPNKTIYGEYLGRYETTGVDDNFTNHIQGNINLGLDLMKYLSFSTSFGIDYNEGIRDLFYPGTLMETINYMSNYYGYSQKFVFSNKLSFNKEFNKSNVTVLMGSDYSEDLYRYNFGRAYDGSNDYIKLNVVDGDPNNPEYLNPRGDLRVLRWSNKEKFHLHSLYGRMSYSYNEVVDLAAVLRWDGSSTVQRNKRWIFTPAVGAKWNIDKQLGWNDLFNIEIGYSRIGKPVFNSRYAAGPQYASDLGWTGDPTVTSYFGYAGISRDYGHGWIDYNLEWAYSDKYEFNLRKGFFNNIVNTTFGLYQRDDKNQIILVPAPEEYGYVGQFKNGLSIRNQGFEATVEVNILNSDNSKLGWTAVATTNLNRNKVLSLPNRLDQIIVGDRLLKVGHGVDKFWLYNNIGIYNSLSEVPNKTVNGEAKSLTYNGVPFQVGDAKWMDTNSDFVINEDDKVLLGRFTPRFFGAFNNSFDYRGFDLNFTITYALGVNALNQRASNRYNFINAESGNSINAIREIFHWQQDVDIRKYPIYNTWSGTNPYRSNQDLFLEDASYARLRSLSIGYDFSRLTGIKEFMKTVKRAYLYINANNLFTVTPFSGNDPELVNFNGVYDGYGLPMTKSFILGLKLDL